MKNTKITRVISLVFALALLVSAIVGITASAEDAATPKIEIDKVNVAYNEMLHLTFTLKGTENAPAGATIGVMTWSADIADRDESNYTAVYTATVTESGTYYKTGGVAATDIDNAVYFAACYKYNGEYVVCETPFYYSITKYLGTRLTEDNLTVAQADLYAKLIKYAIASNKILDKDGEKYGTPNYAFVKAVDGYVGNHGQTIGGWAGKEVLLRAEAKDSDGKYFLGWANEDGVIVSENRLFWVNCPESGIATYTATYGDKDSSMYKSTFDFEAHYAVATGNTYDKLSLSMNTTYGMLNIMTDPITGDKELYVNRTKSGGNYTITNEKGVAGNIGCELDITRYDLQTADQTSLEHFTIYTDKKGTTNDQAVRLINFVYLLPSKAIRIDLGGGGSICTFTPEIGETYTFGMTFQKKSTTTVDEATGEETVTFGVDFTFYLNGKAIGTYDAMSIKNFKDVAANIDMENFFIDKYSFVGYNAAADRISLDNFTVLYEYKN